MLCLHPLDRLGTDSPVGPTRLRLVAERTSERHGLCKTGLDVQSQPAKDRSILEASRGTSKQRTNTDIELRPKRVFLLSIQRSQTSPVRAWSG